MSFASDRLFLNRRIEAAALRPANDNTPATTEADVLQRRRPAKPSADYRRLSARLAKRQMVGDPHASNDNQGWPLAEQLRRDGNEVLLHVAERYRAIYNAAKFEPRLVGTMPDDFWSPEQRHGVGKDGVTRRKGAKSGKRAMPAGDGTSKAVAVTEDAWEDMVASGPKTFHRRPSAPVMRMWRGDDALIAAIDAKPMLYRLQAALGPLVDPFEDAVIGDKTLTEIGRSRGAGVRGESAAGKVLVMMGLQTVQAEFASIDRYTSVGRTANTAANG